MLKPVGGNKAKEAKRAVARALPLAPRNLNRVAVLLNRNAKRVNDRMARKFERIVGTDNVFYSRSLEEAEAYSREIVQQGYGTVVCGGGDGTLINAFNMIKRYVTESNAWRRNRYERFGEIQQLLNTPRFAFLKLGTGNGMTNVVGAADPTRDLKQIVDYAPGYTRSISLATDGDESFFFAGLGYDSLILNDYNLLKRQATGAITSRLMQGLTGYLAAILGKTVPGILLGRNRGLDAKIITRGPAHYIDPRRGDFLEALPEGTTLFEGKAGMVGVGTIPYYGYNFKVFPFAGMQPGMLQLRVAKVGPLQALANLGAIWRGGYRHPEKMLDFFVQDVEIRLQNPYPFQHSGDAKGMRDRIRIGVTEEPLDLVDLHRPRRFS